MHVFDIYFNYCQILNCINPNFNLFMRIGTIDFYDFPEPTCWPPCDCNKYGPCLRARQQRRA